MPEMSTRVVLHWRVPEGGVKVGNLRVRLMDGARGCDE